MTWWMVLLLIFGILFLIGCIPVGVDAAYLGGSFTLKVKIWLLRLQILPAKPKKPKMEKASAAKDGKSLPEAKTKLQLRRKRRRRTARKSLRRRRRRRRS